MSPVVHEMLTRYRDTGETSWFNALTFRHVADYMATGEEDARLPIALADIGYTRDELAQLRADGKAINDIVDEILARGVQQDDDDD